MISLTNRPFYSFFPAVPVCAIALLLSACASQKEPVADASINIPRYGDADANADANAVANAHANADDNSLPNEASGSVGAIQEEVAATAHEAIVQKESVRRSEALVREKRLEIAAMRKNKMALADHAMVLPSSQPTPSFVSAQVAEYGASVHWPTLPPEQFPSSHYEADGENYAELERSPVFSVSQNPVSTFSIDVDTGSYTNVRRILNQGRLPQPNAVRVEEFINYFDYDYPTTTSIEQPFSVTTELAEAPWSELDQQGNRKHALLKIGLKAFEPSLEKRPPANLVFLVDVSGSMSASNKLPLLKKSLIMLSKQLTEKDRVSLVVYAGASGVVLENCPGNDTQTISNALNSLQAGGSTNGQAGIEQAYQLAKKWQVSGGINRVMLATDGDFNVGISNVETLKSVIERKREQGISLSTLGLGSGNYNDHLMEQLANVGNGSYAYIDTLKEAQKSLVESLSATIMTVAKDVKIQIEFNPRVVEEYRLVGYENRALNREDFNNDKVDAGEIGAGHTVTAIYELALAGQGASRMDELRYQIATPEKELVDSRSHNINYLANEMAFLKVRYKQPEGSHSRLMSFPIEAPKELATVESASRDFKFSSAVAYFGEVLRNSPYVGRVNSAIGNSDSQNQKLGNGTQGVKKRVDNNAFQTIINLANASKGKDEFGYRSEFVQLVRLAESLGPAT